MPNSRLFTATLLALAITATATQGQTLDEVQTEAGASWELVACAAMYNMADRIAAEGGAQVTAVVGGGELLGMGAAMVRTDAMGEDTETAVAMAIAHVDRTTAIMAGVYEVDPEGFPAVVDWPEKMATCDRYAAAVAEMMGAPAE